MTMVRKISNTRTILTAIFTAVLAALVICTSAPASLAQVQAQQADQQSTSAQPQQSVANVQDDVRGVLMQYGRFVQHAKYGEVWIPTVTPQGWHPYPPCNWVNTKKYGWFYDDKTPWGAIVHHYGRWVSDSQLGWIWTPGAEFSPGWVVWRTSPEWVGWAPMLPDADVQAVSNNGFNSAAYWIFVETQKFAQGCNRAAPPSQVPMLLTQTTYVTDVRLVYGITIIVLPGFLVGPWIDIDIVFSPWPAWFLAQNLIDWNFMWNNLAPIKKVPDQDCPPVSPKQGEPKPLPVSNPLPPIPPQPLPLPPRPKPIDPPVVIVVPPVCPPGTVMDDGACRRPAACRDGLIRIGNNCVPPIVRPDPLPKPPVNPCANLTGIELRRCIIGHRPNGDGKPTGPVAGNGDGRPNGNPPPANGGETKPRPNGPTGGVNPSRPDVRPNGPQIDVPKNKLPTTTGMPMRPNPNPVVLGGGGVNKTTVGAASQASNAPVHRPLPLALPKHEERKTVVR